uniref:Uncharacterized protein LOC116958287 isoform X2 n=1 Tax=Petromyzon marinus TaxID=7757 RepID=A0AAJ7XJK6_PETMA|nr:uncharacterized protein LOC116958287 isoform X2 [Petromyzon marinus]
MQLRLSCVHHLNGPCQALVEPCQALEEPCQALEEPCQALVEPCQALVEPCQALVEPCQALVEPCQALEEPCQALVEPCQALVEPCQALVEPCQALVEPCQALVEPCQALVEPCQALVEPCQALVEPCQALVEPCQALVEPCQALVEPCQALVEPCQALVEPCQALVEPCQALVEPCQALVEPCQALVEPCQALVEPCQALVEPCQAHFPLPLRSLSQLRRSASRWIHSTRAEFSLCVSLLTGHVLFSLGETPPPGGPAHVTSCFLEWLHPDTGGLDGVDGGRESSFYCRFKSQNGPSAELYEEPSVELRAGPSLPYKMSAFLALLLDPEEAQGGAPRGDQGEAHNGAPRGDQGDSRNGAPRGDQGEAYDGAPHVDQGEAHNGAPSSAERCLLLFGRRVKSAYTAPHRLAPELLTFTTSHAPNCVLTHVDERAVPLLGFLPQELVGSSLLSYIHPSDHALILNLHRRIVSGGGGGGGGGGPLHHTTLRVRTQAGGFATLDSSWWARVSPWSRKVELLTGRHHVLTTRRPSTLDVFAPCLGSTPGHLGRDGGDCGDGDGGDGGDDGDGGDIRALQEEIEKLLLQPVHRSLHLSRGDGAITPHHHNNNNNNHGNNHLSHHHQQRRIATERGSQHQPVLCSELSGLKMHGHQVVTTTSSTSSSSSSSSTSSTSTTSTTSTSSTTSSSSMRSRKRTHDRIESPERSPSGASYQQINSIHSIIRYLESCMGRGGGGGGGGGEGGVGGGDQRCSLTGDISGDGDDGDTGDGGEGDGGEGDGGDDDDGHGCFRADPEPQRFVDHCKVEEEMEFFGDQLPTGPWMSVLSSDRAWLLSVVPLQPRFTESQRRELSAIHHWLGQGTLPSSLNTSVCLGCGGLGSPPLDASLPQLEFDNNNPQPPPQPPPQLAQQPQPPQLY